ncbi:MAG TPA: hypothetical protein VD927_13475 [Chryseosolibacter sp.]|nr:hypothetical protein [Chryseosolibacter sp.]
MRIFYSIVIAISVFIRCGEPCQDRYGKESIQITQSKAIDSIQIDSQIRFDRSEEDVISFYNSGWINTNESAITFFTYFDSIETSFSIDIQNDQSLSIYIAGVNEMACDENDIASIVVQKNNIRLCYQYEKVECP